MGYVSESGLGRLNRRYCTQIRYVLANEGFMFSYLPLEQFTQQLTAGGFSCQILIGHQENK
jgi:hypothetical protein